MKVAVILTRVQTVQYKLEIQTDEHKSTEEILADIKHQSDAIVDIAKEDLRFTVGRKDCRIVLNDEKFNIVPLIGWREKWDSEKEKYIKEISWLVPGER